MFLHLRILSVLSSVVLILAGTGWGMPQSTACSDNLLALCEEAQNHVLLCKRLRHAKPVANLLDYTGAMRGNSGIEEDWLQVRKLNEYVDPECRYIDSIVRIRSTRSIPVTNIVRLLFNFKHLSNSVKVTLLRLTKSSADFSEWFFEIQIVSRHILGSPVFDEDALWRFYVSINLSDPDIHVKKVIEMASEFGFNAERTESKQIKNQQILEDLNRQLSPDDQQKLLSRLIVKNKKLNAILARNDRYKLDHGVFNSLHLLFQVFEEYTVENRISDIGFILFDIKKTKPNLSLSLDFNSREEYGAFIKRINATPGFTSFEKKKVGMPESDIPGTQEIVVSLDLDKIRKASDSLALMDPRKIDINDYKVIWRALSSQAKIHQK